MPRLRTHYHRHLQLVRPFNEFEKFLATNPEGAAVIRHLRKARLRSRNCIGIYFEDRDGRSRLQVTMVQDGQLVRVDCSGIVSRAPST
ncbi:MAG: hypothetical protein ACYDD1_09050 [Caulobacteraceae bacterium]